MDFKSNKFFKEYINESCRALNALDLEKLDFISQIIFKKIKLNKKIFVCGNGGASSISNHFLCDFNKNIKLSSKDKLYPKIISLSNSIELITAIGNDISFDDIFVNQIENYIEKDDLIIVFSCSGKSKNILKLINYAKKKKKNNKIFQVLKKNKKKKKKNKILIKFK